MRDTIVDALFGVAFVLVVLLLTVDSFTATHLTLAYLFLVAIACNQYDSRVHSGISPLLSLQIGLLFALGTGLIVLVVGGLGVRTLELVAVFALLLVFVLTRDDLPAYLPTALPYLVACFVVVGIFLYHAREFGAGSGLGLFPVFAGILLAFNVFVLPRYVSTDAVYWTVATVAAAVTLVGIPAALAGDYTLWIFEVRTWGGSVSIPLLDAELSIVRSVFANPNTFGLLAFPGTLASAVLVHRTLTRSSVPLVAVVPLCLFAITLLGTYLSNSRASMLAAAVAVAFYLLAATDRRLVPVAVAAIALGVPAFLAAVYLSALPIDPANRFTLWRAGLEAVYRDSGLLGQGIVGTRAAIEPYLEIGGSVHNSYLSMFIRAGFLGGVAYAVLVLGPLVHGALGYARVDTGMLALAVAFAVHQLFEGYTLFQFGHGSILGALAVGYVLVSLADGSPTAAPSENESAATDSRSADDRGDDSILFRREPNRTESYDYDDRL
ncbi:MAG: O-antigen ligase family protein [Halalkalicoccus sp.]